MGRGRLPAVDWEGQGIGRSMSPLLSREAAVPRAIAGLPVTVRVALVVWDPQVQAYSPASSRRTSCSTNSTTGPFFRISRRPSACNSRPPLLQTTVELGVQSSQRRQADAPSSTCRLCRGSRNPFWGIAGRGREKGRVRPKPLISARDPQVCQQLCQVIKPK